MHFFEDDSPSELAIIEVGDQSASNQDINALVYNAISKDVTGFQNNVVTTVKEPPSMTTTSIPDVTPSPDLVPTESPSPPQPRRSGCECKPPGHFAFFAVNDTTTNGSTNITFIATSNEPRTYQEAIHSPHSKQWELVVQSEFLQLCKLKVFEVVDGLPKERKAIGSQIVFREKYDGHGNLIKFKAHIITKGFSQVPGEDFTKTFSSVAKFLTLCTFFSYVAYLDWELHHIDIVAAYLHGPLDEEIYMTISEGVKGFNSGHYWKLKKVLYGLEQAGRQWKKCLHEALTFFGFSRAVANDCLYVK